MAKLFGTDGIRGEANQYPMDAGTALAVGQAVGHLFRKPGRQPRVVIGRDTRVSGPMLESAVRAGLLSMGGIAYSVGVLPTPGIAFISQGMRADAGIVISASHNPYQDNGIKIFAGNGFKLRDDQEETIESLILSGKLQDTVPGPKDMGRSCRVGDAEGRYIVFLKSSFPRELSMEGLKIVLDTANGATFKVAPAVFSELGAKVEVLHDHPDGLNINDRCGSQYTQDLQKRVVETGSAMGLAFDGDGDRLIAVDEKGKALTGDQILITCARTLQKLGTLKNDLLVSTVMSNLGLIVACRKYGFRHHSSQVGDRHVLEDMRGLGAVIGGEDSGHMIFLDHHTTGDGILAALQLVAAMIRQGRPLSELAGQMEVFPQKLINVPVNSKPEIEGVPRLMEAIRTAEREMGDQGRVLVRYSGTQNVCRVMVEGPTNELTEKHCRQIAEAVKAALG